MTELDFAVLDAVPDRYAAAPTLALRLRITESTGAHLWAIALRCQIRIEPQRRQYTGAEMDGLVDLFGESGRWGDTVKPFSWLHTTVMVPGFSTDIELDLPVQCSYDFEVAGAKYLHALRDGDIPLLLLFSGTAFAREGTGFQVEQIPWHKEATYRLPVRVWRDLMDAYFPNSGWIRIERDTLDALQRYKSARAMPTWEQAFGALLAEAGETAR